MSSNRPDTSIPPTTSAPPDTNTDTERSLSVIAPSKYVPRAGDLVVSLPRTVAATKLHIPSSLLQSEAVDSSLELGRGASFTVTRQAVPSGPNVMIDCLEMSKIITLKMPFNTQRRPKYVVYKSPKISFQPNGEPTSPQDRRALQSVLTEIHSLLHPPLLRHANIIDILGVAWGSNEADLSHQLPVLVVEYADRGTLADVQLNGNPLSDELKLQIALGIASGLQALHSESIVHGDIKPENILMCSSTDNILVPKLGDFGFAIIEAAESPEVSLGGTRAWRAPESNTLLPVHMLKFTDVYSWGLVVWFIALDGQHPFELFLLDMTQSEDGLKMLDKFKADDKALLMSKFEAWVPIWSMQVIAKTTLGPKGGGAVNTHYGTLESQAVNVTERKQAATSAALRCEDLRQRCFYGSLERVFALSLSKIPQDRDLGAAIEELTQAIPAEVIKDLSDLRISDAGPEGNMNVTFEIQPARTEESRRPYSVIPAKDPFDDSPGITSPLQVLLQLHPGKAAGEMGFVPGRGVSLTILGPSQELEEGTDMKQEWNTIYFQIEHKMADQIARYATFFQIAQGYGMAFVIPKRAGRSSFHINHFENEGAQTWQLRFPEEARQEDYQVFPPLNRTQRINWASLGYKNEVFSWQSIRDLEPAVQRFLVGTLQYRTDLSIPFSLSACLMNGYGVRIDTDAALENMAQAARRGNALALAYVYRFFQACDRPLPADIPVLENLRVMALSGSRTALQDLAKVGNKMVHSVWWHLKHGYGGVGAGWYLPDQWLHGLSADILIQDKVALDEIGSHKELSNLTVNLRGDGLLHATAATGSYRLMERLLDDYNMDVNQRNRHGETPLLCAARAGHGLVVELLLDHHASAILQAENGETPLHWLISFSIGPAALKMGQELVNRGGANVDACTNRNISHAHFQSHIDVDYQLPGTPLLWAVRRNRPDIVSFLLSVGADSQKEFRMPTPDAPLAWAAVMHHTTCLQRMISHLETRAKHTGENASKDITYGPLIRCAIHAADKFSMIIRNSSFYLTQLEATLRLLQEKTKNRHLNVAEDYETPLGFAVSEAHDEAAEIILKIGWGVEDINKPHNSNGRTPLLDAVRWNRRHMVRILLDHGADALAFAVNPFDQAKRNWSALHVFAEQAHNVDLEVVEDLLEAGVPIDGRYDEEVETPLHVAVRRNAYALADLLLSKGANLNALSTRSSLLVSSHPLTGLGHIIALNARHCFAGLRYLLGSHSGVTQQTTDFIVDPVRHMSALHLCAAVPNGLQYISGDPRSVKDFDYATNSRIAHELLDKFRERKQVNERCNLEGRTALHLAAVYGNFGVAKELFDAGADVTLLDDNGETAAQIARHMYSDDDVLCRDLLEWME